MIVQMTHAPLRTKYGVFEEYLYYDGQRETIALVMGDISQAEMVLCRVHSTCILGHYFNSMECDCQEQMDTSQQLIQQEGRGIIILMDQEGKGNGHFALLNSIRYKKQGMAQSDAYVAAGFSKDSRDFSSAAKILLDLEVQSIVMLTDNPNKINTLVQAGIQVAGTRVVQLAQ